VLQCFKEFGIKVTDKLKPLSLDTSLSSDEKLTVSIDKQLLDDIKGFKEITLLFTERLLLLLNEFRQLVELLLNVGENC